MMPIQVLKKKPFIFTENGFNAMKEMRLAMREVEVELPDEFGGYILTGATCYTTFPSCKMAVYATVSVELICFCGADINADNNIGHSRNFLNQR